VPAQNREMLFGHSLHEGGVSSTSLLADSLTSCLSCHK
jgi:hypothetical protein